MITIQHVFYLVGGLFGAWALLSAFDRTNPKRFGNAAFWGLVALSLVAGHRLGDVANGFLVLGLAALATLKLIGRGAPSTGEADRAAAGERYGNKLFLPILVVLITAVAGTLLYLYTPLHGTGLFEPNRETFILLCLGVLLALALIFAWLKPPPLAPLDEGRRLIDAVGWAAVLPLMLAALGLVLADTGVGKTIGGLVLTVIPEGTVLPAVIAYGLGMAIFTILTGNAFAAFPVMATAIGVPLLIQGYGGDAAVVGAIGMLAGFCGTLMTPMAANFNIVPAALLELKDQNGVIKAQIGTALPLLLVNILLIYFLAF
ncbi:MAG TPA: DUF979 domain-containing protein [Allosphingosinicella sp.]|uniref:DUF979 domain-containing protein n=1 Tax=Allosphingosinicella sp. TaxID=2823234 RepID=UPI002F29297D